MIERPNVEYEMLTQNHSGSFINPSWFALSSSRGVEEQLLKVYMRSTVVISEYLVYIPGAILLNRSLSKFAGVGKWESSIALVAILMQPATILIDHAHFQYNTVMLGFVLASVASILSERYMWSCVFFVAALGFKQMALYYAPAMFAFLLGICMAPGGSFLRFSGIALTTFISFAAVFAPMVLGAWYDNYRGINPPLSLTDRQTNPLLAQLTPYIDPTSIYYPILLQLTQVVHRMFPFARGIFEDKVANVWCSIHIIHKLHVYPIDIVKKVSFVATLMAILPSTYIISLFPRRDILPWALASSAWGFFLFSFQVHEKSVLLPLLPMTILLGGNGGLGTDLRAWIGWANILGAWTLFPLLKRDELRIPYYVLTAFWAYLLALPPTSLSCYFTFSTSRPFASTQPHALGPAIKFLHLSFYAAMFAWHVAEAFIPPPVDKPDLYVVLNVIIGAAGFGICYLWCNWQLMLRSGLLEDWFGYRAQQEALRPQDRAKALPLSREGLLVPWFSPASLGDGKKGDKDKKVEKKTRATASPQPPTTRKTRSSVSPAPSSATVTSSESPKKKSTRSRKRA